MESDEKLPRCARTSFVYEGLVLLVAWGITVMLMTVALGTYALMHVQTREALIRPMVFLIASSVFILLITWVLVASRSEVLIDDRGISRAIFGWIWQTIEWRNTKVIRSFPTSRGDGRVSRTFAVHPLTRPGFSLTLKGIMVFNERLDNFPELLALLNKYIRLNDIHVETSRVVFGGDWVAAESL